MNMNVLNPSMRAETSASYDSCSTGDLYPGADIARFSDFDHEVGMGYGRFHPDGAWPMHNAHRESLKYGPPMDMKSYGNAGPLDRLFPNYGPMDGMKKGNQLMPQRRAGDQFDQASKRMVAKPEPTQKGVKLGSSWTYWHISSEGGTEADWKEGMKPMCTFDYKEQFWGMWNSVKPPSELSAKRELALFRGGFGRRPVWPDWNDTENVEGGRWKIIFRVTELPQIVDNFWRDLMVHCIEERWVPYSGFVNGVSITVKGQFYRIYVWLCSSKPAHIEFIRDRAKELLKDIPYVQMDYITGNGERPQQRGLGLGPLNLQPNRNFDEGPCGPCRCDSVPHRKDCPEQIGS